MTQKLICNIPSASKQYEIEIGSGLLNSQNYFLDSLASRFVIVTDDIVGPLHGEPFQQLLSSLGLEVYILTFPSGEKYKTRETKESLENTMFEKGMSRDTCVIGLGGGVVLDVAGYLAATFCRGVPLVMVPTTLLGMVDASIGGKTGVNVPYGKNMVGSIYQPKKVVSDLNTLKTLPKREFSNGVVEMIKHGLIADAKVFEELESESTKLLELDPIILRKAIYHSCRIKKSIVEEDERELGRRRLLNYGHTVGHALEHSTDFALSHGEAVAIGLLVESYLSIKLGHLNTNVLNRIKNLLVKYGLPLQLPYQPYMPALFDAMALDKKSEKGQPRFVMINDIGVPETFDNFYCTQIDKALVKEALEWMVNDLCYY